MAQGTHFDWRTLGKADYSQAYALVASLPEEDRKCLKGVSAELLSRLIHLSWVFAERSGRGVGYCWPTLKTLAKYLHRTERTVERHLCVMRKAGLIVYTRRLTSMGAWTSNLYQMGSRFLAMLMARKSKKTQQFRDPTKMSTNNLKKGYNAAQSPAQALYKPPAWMKSIDSADIAPSGANPAISDSVIKPKSGVTHQPSRHEVLYIPSIEYDASAVETRKAQLKHQLELLKERGL